MSLTFYESISISFTMVVLLLVKIELIHAYVLSSESVVLSIYVHKSIAAST